MAKIQIKRKEQKTKIAKMHYYIVNHGFFISYEEKSKIS